MLGRLSGPLSLVVSATLVVVALATVGPWHLQDLAWTASQGHALIHSTPYVTSEPAYPPGSLMLYAPLRMLDWQTLRLVSLAVFLGCMALIAWCCLQLTGKASARATAALLLVLALSGPGWAALNLGNMTVLATTLALLAVVAISKDRWAVAGLLMGASLTVKPMAVLLPLLWVYRRRWRSLGLVVLVPLVANSVGLLVAAEPMRFFTYGVPRILGSYARYAGVNVSLQAITSPLGVPRSVGVVLVLVVVGAGVWAARRMPLLESAGVLGLLCVLAPQHAWHHYLLLATPLLVALVMRRSMAALAVVPVWLVGGPLGFGWYALDAVAALSLVGWLLAAQATRSKHAQVASALDWIVSVDTQAQAEQVRQAVGGPVSPAEWVAVRRDVSVGWACC